MTHRTNSNNQHNDKTVTDSIKNTAGAAFHTVHSALETTENVAMSAVDGVSNATKNAVDATTKMVNNMKTNRDDK